MMPQQPLSGDSASFQPKRNGERKDCIVELDLCTDLGTFKTNPLGQPQSIHDVRQMVKQGRPAVVIIIPPGMKFEASSKETFLENLKRLSELKPIIMVFGGK
jgi:hypothetical protein